MTPIPKLSQVEFSPAMRGLVDSAKSLYQSRLAYFAQTHKPPAYICCAPGRVNLIGEHVDYQNGFVLPFALNDYCTVVYGTGFLHTGKSSAKTMIRLRLCSDQAAKNADASTPSSSSEQMIEERRWSGNDLRPPTSDDERTWVNYVVGVIVQYLPDIPQEGCVLDLAMAYSSNVPLGAGLSSSAALEVATATFLECFLHDGMAYSSVTKDKKEVDFKITRALRCQKAENVWALSPCGILDQFASSCCQKNHVMLLDCQNLETTQFPLKQKNVDDDNDDGQPTIAFLICNSKVSHEIADSEYGARRKECYDAVLTLQQVPLYHVTSLRDAIVKDLDTAKDKLGDTLYRRAHHVVTEITRTKECATALKLGLWDKVGELMTASHRSLQNDYEVSCVELDTLVDLALAQSGVYGSRMTGGGFGGCTVTLCQADRIDAIKAAICDGYAQQYGGIIPDCFVTIPGPGASILAIDMECKPKSDYYT